MKLPRIFNNGLGNYGIFRLTSLYLHQLNYDGKTIRRSVKRSQLARYFQGETDISLDGRYPGESWEKNRWGIFDAGTLFPQKDIYIGCVHFNAKATRLLKRWALDGKTSRRSKQTS